MARIVSLLALFICFSLTTNAQKKQLFKNKKRLTTEQLTTLKVKKMTLELELTEVQQKKLTPVITKQISERKIEADRMRESKNEVKNIYVPVLLCSFAHSIYVYEPKIHL